MQSHFRGVEASDVSEDEISSDDEFCGSHEKPRKGTARPVQPSSMPKPAQELQFRANLNSPDNGSPDAMSSSMPAAAKLEAPVWWTASVPVAMGQGRSIRSMASNMQKDSPRKTSIEIRVPSRSDTHVISQEVCLDRNGYSVIAEASRYCEWRYGCKTSKGTVRTDMALVYNMLGEVGVYVPKVIVTMDIEF